MANNTWSGLTSEQDQIWENLWNEYVPMSGTAETIGGEILRAMSRIIYRFYNDGDMVGVGYGNETCNSSDRYLEFVVPNYISLDQFNGAQETEYETLMLKNHRTVFAFLQQNPSIFKIQNATDSREASEEDYRREREQEDYLDDCYEEWDECCDEPEWEDEDCEEE